MSILTILINCTTPSTITATSILVERTPATCTQATPMHTTQATSTIPKPTTATWTQIIRTAATHTQATRTLTLQPLLTK